MLNRSDVNVGDRIPDFELPDQDGQPVARDDLLGDGPLVIFFYPKDESPGCTQEACAFRDRYEVFSEAGATVVGISSDDVSSHAAFAEKLGLPFTLLADTNDTVRDAFAVPKTLGLLPGRVTYVVDEDGVVRHRFKSSFNMEAHAEEALRVVQALADDRGDV